MKLDATKTLKSLLAALTVALFALAVAAPVTIDAGSLTVKSAFAKNGADDGADDGDNSGRDGGGDDGTADQGGDNDDDGDDDGAGGDDDGTADQGTGDN